MLMSNRINLLILFSFILLLVGCAGGLPDVNPNSMHAGMSSESGKLVDPSSHMAWEDENDPEANNGSGKNCKVQEQADATKMVYSDYNDWYLYVDRTAQVDCDGRGGSFSASYGSATVSVKVLTPMRDSDFTEKGVRKEMARRHAKTLAGRFGFSKSFSYKSFQLGDAERPAMCADVKFIEGSIPKHLLSCITAVENVNGDILAHTVDMTVDEETYEPEQSFERVASVSASWFRTTDSDGAGNLLNIW